MCVPCLLTLDQQYCWKDVSTNCLALYMCNQTKFLRWFITIDEPWGDNIPETKQQSEQWTVKGEQTPKKAEAILSAGKVVATVFWGLTWVIFINYLENGKTSISGYYANLLHLLNDKIKKKWLHLAKRKCCSTKTMHHLTHQWLKSNNWSLNWFLTHHSRPI